MLLDDLREDGTREEKVDSDGAEESRNERVRIGGGRKLKLEIISDRKNGRDGVGESDAGEEWQEQADDGKKGMESGKSNVPRNCRERSVGHLVVAGRGDNGIPSDDDRKVRANERVGT